MILKIIAFIFKVLNKCREDYLQKNNLWVTAKGDIVKISAMSDAHLNNTHHKLYREGQRHTWEYAAISKEIHIRTNKT